MKKIGKYYCPNCGNVQSLRHENICKKCNSKMNKIKIEDVYNENKRKKQIYLVIILGIISFLLSFTVFPVSSPIEYNIVRITLGTAIILLIIFIILVYSLKISKKKSNNKIRDIYYNKIQKPYNLGLTKNNEKINKNQKPEDKYNLLKDELIQLNRTIDSLSEKLTNGEISSDAFSRARDDFERKKKEIEEELWKLRNKLFKDDYEKPF